MGYPCSVLSAQDFFLHRHAAPFLTFRRSGSVPAVRKEKRMYFDAKEFGKRLHDVRTSSGITQEELAVRLGLASKQHVSRMENGERSCSMLDLNLPKHSYVFLRKHLEEGIYQVSAVSASDVLKRNTDSLRCAVENDVFASLPQDSLLDELEMGWEDEQ